MPHHTSDAIMCSSLIIITGITDRCWDGAKNPRQIKSDFNRTTITTTKPLSRTSKCRQSCTEIIHLTSSSSLSLSLFYGHIHHYGLFVPTLLSCLKYTDYGRRLWDDSAINPRYQIVSDPLPHIQDLKQDDESLSNIPSISESCIEIIHVTSSCVSCTREREMARYTERRNYIFQLFGLHTLHH